jgi:hypothetical protein
MIRRLLRRLTFDHLAVAFVFVVMAGVYYLATGALLRNAEPPLAARADGPARAEIGMPGKARHASFRSGGNFDPAYASGDRAASGTS